MNKKVSRSRREPASARLAFQSNAIGDASCLQICQRHLAVACGWSHASCTVSRTYLHVKKFYSLPCLEKSYCSSRPVLLCEAVLYCPRAWIRARCPWIYCMRVRNFRDDISHGDPQPFLLWKERLLRVVTASDQTCWSSHGVRGAILCCRARGSQQTPLPSQTCYSRTLSLSPADCLLWMCRWPLQHSPCSTKVWSSTTWDTSDQPVLLVRIPYSIIHSMLSYPGWLHLSCIEEGESSSNSGTQAWSVKPDCLATVMVSPISMHSIEFLSSPHAGSIHGA